MLEVSQEMHSAKARSLPPFLLAALLGACGGGGGGSPPPPGPTQNANPVVASPIPDRTVAADHPFAISSSEFASHFSDPDGDPLRLQFDVGSVAGVNWTPQQISGSAPQGTYDIRVAAVDSRGLTASTMFRLVVRPNSPPVVTEPNVVVFAIADAWMSFDASNSGRTFTDVDGDSMTYTVTFESNPMGLGINGTHVSGALSEVGVVQAKITADDGLGGKGEDIFSIVLPAPEPGNEPALPFPPLVYDDYEIPLPQRLLRAREMLLGLYDRTPANNVTSNSGAALGRVLFYDKRLSITNTIACASCHHQSSGFADITRFSVGVLGVPTTRNSMALANLRYNLENRHFMDHRIETLEAMVLEPIKNPVELGMPLAFLETKLAQTTFYPELFQAAFGSPEVTSDRIARALAQFLRSMLSFKARYDDAHRTLDGDWYPDPLQVFTPEEILGENVFKSLCNRCHRDFLHVMQRTSNIGLDLVPADEGAGGGTFRAASLRNIGVSEPYMHDGRFQTLREVIDHYDTGIQKSFGLAAALRDGMGEPIRLNLSDADKSALEAFLLSLTDNDFISDPRFSDPFD